MHQIHSNGSQKRASPYSTTQKCPVRMFLSEAIHCAWETKPETKIDDDTSSSTPLPITNDKGRTQLLRIMGIVVTNPSLSKYESSDRITAQYCWAFLLDDGTAIIDVVLMSGEDRREEKSVLQKGDHQHVKEFKKNIDYRPSQLELSEGDCVDCIGKIEYSNLHVHANGDVIEGVCQQALSKKDSKKCLTKDHKNEYQNAVFEPVACFVARTVSKVSDPNIFILRMAELSFSAERSLGIDDGISNEGGKANETGIYMYGDLMAEDPNKERSRILDLMQLSRPDGLSENELATLLGCEKVEECNSLRHWLGDMHANFEIYQNKDGSYLPL